MKNRGYINNQFSYYTYNTQIHFKHDDLFLFITDVNYCGLQPKLLSQKIDL